MALAGEAREAAAKAEADLQALSESYNALESEMEDLLVCLGVEVRRPHTRRGGAPRASP